MSAPPMELLRNVVGSLAGHCLVAKSAFFARFGRERIGCICPIMRKTRRAMSDNGTGGSGSQSRSGVPPRQERLRTGYILHPLTAMKCEVQPDD